MTRIDRSEPAAMKQLTLPRRDWILLPALGLLTVCFMAVSAELLSRWLYPVTQVGFKNCFATDDPTGNAAVNPNSVCWEQIPESSLKVEYRFNRRGHRAGTELNPKSPDTYRIVLIGSSFTQGLFVPREKTFAALLPKELSMETGRKVEVYNEATGGRFRGGPFPTQNSAHHFDEVLAAQPDLILWVITPDDVVNAESKAGAAFDDRGAHQQDPLSATRSSKPQSFWNKLTASIAEGTLGERLRSRWEGTRTSIVLKHLLIASESQDEYIRSYLRSGDNANALKTEPDANWQMELQYFQGELAEIVERAEKEHLPLVAVFVPNRPQAAMISRGAWPPGYDPYKLANEVRGTVVSHGGKFIDLLPHYRGIPSPERFYFPVDGHPDADGQAIIFSLLAKELARGVVPELKAAAPADIAMEPGK
jgi:hypothetical protein